MGDDREPAIDLVVDGKPVSVAAGTATLLELLRETLGIRSVKDGCSPQGQCGCCTVLVDGVPRVACVTPARRLAGRSVTTLDGFDVEDRARWAEAFATTGASQCGFCTPGIIVRLQALRAAGVDPGDQARVERALQAHLCRCTGWRTIVDAFARAAGPVDRSRAVALSQGEGAARRASLEGGAAQRVGPDVALGGGGFADDTAPADALVAVPDGRDGFVVGETLAEARQRAGKVQGRRTTIEPRLPLDLPPGDWDVRLRTTWVEPAYLETDASWCAPGGEPASPLANGGAFGAKRESIAPAVARRLADEHGRTVRVVLSREDCVRLGPKRPPVAAGLRRDGHGVLRAVRTAGIADAVRTVAPDLVVEEVDVAGPPTSVAIRAAGWAEAAVLLAAATTEAGRGPGGATVVRVVSPDGAEAVAEVGGAAIRVQVACGDPLDEVVLRSYCVGAAHMGASWVTSEGLAVDDDGVVQDLTIRSFGILRAVDTPPVEVEVVAAGGPPVNGSDAVFAAVAAATWIHQGCPEVWPTGPPGARGARR